MIAPLIDAPPGVLAIPIGIAFGATLERAGLGSARTIANQLTARDFTVVKVMFSAVVTAMLGVFWASRLGWLDLARVAMPVTDVVPQLIGALLFGAGFAVASLCPGTACVSAATGKRDGLFTIAGLFAGTLIVSWFWTQLGAIAERTPRAQATLAGDLGLPAGVVVAGIAVIAVIVIALVDRLKGVTSPSRRFRLSPLATLALGFGLLAAIPGGAPATTSLSDLVEVSPRQLAEWIRDRRSNLRIVDIRDSVAPDDYRIPGAEETHAGDLSGLASTLADTLVLYDDAGRGPDKGSALRNRLTGTVLLLQRGMAGWESDVMAPRAPDPGDSTAVRLFQPVRELSAWFGGKPSHAVLISPPVRRRRSC